MNVFIREDAGSFQTSNLLSIALNIELNFSYIFQKKLIEVLY